MKALKNTFLFLLMTVGAVFILNAIILFCANPVSLHGQDKSAAFKDFGQVKVRSVDNLRSGGLGKASLPVFGYVNITDERDIIYLNKDIADKNPGFTQSSYSYKHEFGMALGKWTTELSEKQLEELKHVDTIWELPYTPLPQNSMKAV